MFGFGAPMGFGYGLRQSTDIVPSLSNLHLSADEIIENSAAATLVGAVTGAKPESVLTLTGNAGGRFALAGGNIVAGATATNFETGTTHEITVRETNAAYANSPRDTIFTINVVNVLEALTLVDLTLSDATYFTGHAQSGTINGARAGSVIVGSDLPAGFSINSGARTWAFTGEAGVSTPSITLTETLADSPNSPRETGIGLTIAAVPVVPPEDWRMPAVVTVSSGLAGYQAALQAGQATAASKSRPSFIVPAGATEYVNYAVEAKATPQLLVFRAGGASNSPGTPTIAIGGVDQGFVPQYPPGSSYASDSAVVANRQQMLLIPAGGARTIRLTIEAGAAERTIYPRLMQLPAAGKWDAHVIFGASREAQNLYSGALEADIIAAYPNRDPVIFNFAMSSQTVDALRQITDELVGFYTGAASYVHLGSIIGNDVTALQTYDGSNKTAIDADIDSICTALAGFTLMFANTSWRDYGLDGSCLTNLAKGSKAYNDNIVHPKILQYAPHCYDGANLRAYNDEYLGIMLARGTLGTSDPVHGAATAQRATLVDKHFRYIYTQGWGTTLVETRVAAAEAGQTVKATALATYTEATYAVNALAASASKTALNARLAVVYPVALFYEAIRLIDIAIGTSSAPDKAAAQTALDAAVTAGYSGGTAPNTVADQQDRIDDIVVATVLRTWKYAANNSGAAFGTVVAGWNHSAQPWSAIFTDANILDDTGTASTVDVILTNPGTGGSTATGTALGDFPAAINSVGYIDNGGVIEFELDGLDPTKVYDLYFYPNRSATGTVRGTRFTVQGGTPQNVDPNANLTTQAIFIGLVPNGAGKITPIRITRDTGNTSSVYMGPGWILVERAP